MVWLTEAEKVKHQAKVVRKQKDPLDIPVIPFIIIAGISSYLIYSENEDLFSPSPIEVNPKEQSLTINVKGEKSGSRRQLN